jgi:hypothetical protein
MVAYSSAQIGAIYQDFQEAVKASDEEYILLADADLMTMPSNLIPRLRALDKDIVAPYVYMRNCIPRMFYDSYVFRLNGYRYHPFRQPMNNNQPINLDSVGTCFLVKRKPFLDVPNDNPYPHMKFCNDARKKGYEVWADPRINVIHLDLTRFGINHFPLEEVMGEPPRNVPFITDSGEVVEQFRLDDEMVAAWVYGE